VRLRSTRSTRSNTFESNTSKSVLRATFWMLALAGIGGSVLLGAIAVANTVTTLPSPRDAQLGRLVDPLSATDAPAVELAALTVDQDPAADAPSDAAPASRGRDATSSPPDMTNAGLAAARAGQPSTADRPTPVRAKIAVAKPAKPAIPTVLSDAQIAALKRRLRLSSGQESYWPEIEASLRGVAQQINEANRKAHGTAPVDITTPEVERLKNAAVPFLMQMRPDQKAEIVALARIIGMEQMVALL